MINHLKSKILITGRNLCYLRSPLVARKKKKIITGYSPPKVECGREGQRGRDSAAASDGWGGRGRTPARGLVRALDYLVEVESAETGGWPSRQRLEFHLWVPLEASSVQRLGPTPPPLPLTPGCLFRLSG